MIRPWKRASACGDRVTIVRARRRAHRLEVRGELGDVRVGHARDRQPAAERLERRADGVGLDDLAPRRAADARPAERRDLDDAERLEPAQRLANRRLARPELAGDLRLDDPRVGRMVAGEDALEDPILDLVGQDAARDRIRAIAIGRRLSARSRWPAAGGRRRRLASRRISTRPVVPSTVSRSPVAIRWVATDVPMTAGMPNSRASTAGCEVVPPVSVTRPAILVNRTTQAGFVIWQTRMSPSRTSSNSSTVRTTRAIPSIDAGRAAEPGDDPLVVGLRLVEAVRVAPVDEVREGELRRRHRADPVARVDAARRPRARAGARRRCSRAAIAVALPIRPRSSL